MLYTSEVHLTMIKLLFLCRNADFRYFIRRWRQENDAVIVVNETLGLIAYMGNVVFEAFLKIDISSHI